MNNLARNALLLTAGSAAAYCSARFVMRQLRRIDFRRRVVTITGGSRGLGLILARRFADEGARLAICARDPLELERAAAELRHRGAPVFAMAVDLARRDHVDEFFQAVREEVGATEILINNAGIIQVGPLDAMTDADFEQAMAVHFWAPYHAMRAVLPEMRLRHSGRIVNISSIGGKMAVPHLTPYCASKFALVGLSDGMRSELAADNVFITTVCPGLMRTGSIYRAQFKGRHREEFGWFSVLGSAPFLSINADAAADQIIDACRHGDPELVISLPAKLAVALNALLPRLLAETNALVSRCLPSMSGRPERAVEGWRSISRWAPSILTELSDRAALQNNEVPR